jgi:hypothetical protein
VRGGLLRRSAIGLAILLAALASLSTGVGEAEQTGRAGVVVSLDPSVWPHRLPRWRPVPVALALAGSIRSTNGSPPPSLSRIEIAFGAPGGLSTAGLARCPRARLRNATQRQALARCRGALIGRGRILIELATGVEGPSSVRAGLLAFNASIAGRPAVWVHAYSASPPVSFVLPFYLRRLRAGAYGILMRAPVSGALGRWQRLRSFQITLGRRYRSHGEWRSYLSARCPLPPRFHIGFFPLARATYHFAAGPTLSTTALRGCRVPR